MGNSIFGIGISGLNAAQIGMTTTGHNISNANTAGFHRQQAVQMTNIPMFTGAGFIGQGVQTDTVKRIYNQFLDLQVSEAQTKVSRFESYSAQVKQIDNLLADVNSGLSPSLQDFFAAVNDVAATSASVPSRQSMLSGAEAMISRLQGLSTRMTEMRDSVNSQIRASVELINSYATQIADLNERIAYATSASNANQPPNDLLDQRGELIANLNKEIKTTVLVQDDGSANVFIGSGQPLVMGQQPMTLSAVASNMDPERLEVGLVAGSSSVILGSSLVGGGNLSGLLAYRSETLDMAQNALGRVAMGLAQTFNDQHRLGQDLNDNPGGDFFTVPVPKVISKLGNPAGLTAAVTVSDVSKLTVEDYNLQWNGAAWVLNKVSNGAAVTMTGTGTAADPFVADGLSIVVGGVPAAGNGFQIQPTRNGARDIALAISDTSKIAAAAPIKTAAAFSTNTGSGKISAGVVNSFNNKVTITLNGAGNAYTAVDTVTGATLASNVAYASPATVAFNGWQVTLTGAGANSTFVVDNLVSSKTSGAGTVSVTAPMAPNTQLRQPDPDLRDPVQIVFDNPPTTFHVVGATTGSPVAGLTFTEGSPISFNGWTVKITGTPAAGDTFSIDPNTNGVADNRNALLLAGLQTKNTLANGTTTFQGTYSQMVSMVGNKANEVKVNGAAQQTLLAQATQAQQSMSGVNLDEEAANLVRFQQAYQASGKMIQIASTMFDTLISLGGR